MTDHYMTAVFKNLSDDEAHKIVGKLETVFVSHCDVVVERNALRLRVQALEEQLTFLKN